MSKAVPFQTIQFSISTQFKCKYTLSKTFLFQAIQSSQTILICVSMQLVLLTHSYGPIRCYNSGPDWTWEQWQWRGAPHSLKLQHYWNLTIRLFSVIYTSLVWGGGLTPLQRSSRCILHPQPTVQLNFVNEKYLIFYFAHFQTILFSACYSKNNFSNIFKRLFTFSHLV